MTSMTTSRLAIAGGVQNRRFSLGTISGPSWRLIRTLEGMCVHVDDAADSLIRHQDFKLVPAEVEVDLVVGPLGKVLDVSTLENGSGVLKYRDVLDLVTPEKGFLTCPHETPCEFMRQVGIQTPDTRVLFVMTPIDDPGRGHMTICARHSKGGLQCLNGVSTGSSLKLKASDIVALVQGRGSEN